MIALAVLTPISIAIQTRLETVSLHRDLYGFGLQLCAPKSSQVTSSSTETHKASRKKTKKVAGHCQIQYAYDKIKRGHNVSPHLLVSLLKLNAVAKPKQLALSHQGSEFVLSIFDRSEPKKRKMNEYYNKLIVRHTFVIKIL